MKQKASVKQRKSQSSKVKVQADSSIIVFLSVVVAIFLVAVFVLRIFTQEKVTQQFNVGVMVPLTGESAALGNSILKSINLAIKDANASNTIKIVTADSMCTGEGTTVAMEHMVEENAIAVIGDICSGGTIAALPIAEQNKIVLLSPASTSTLLDNASQYFFRTIPSDKVQSKIAADLLFGDGKRNIAIIYSDEPYGSSFAKDLRNDFTAVGGTISSFTGFKPANISVRASLSVILEKNPDCVYIVSNSDSLSAAVIVNTRLLNRSMPIYGAEALKSATLINDAGSAAEGVVLTSLVEPSLVFVQNYKAEYGKLPDQYAAQGYDAMKALIIAIRDGATSGEKLKEALKSINFEGYSGQVKFTSTGSVAGGYSAYTVKNGEYVKR